MRSAAVSLACAFAVAVGAGTAIAGPAEDSAREHTKKATAAFNLGSYDEAATEYEAAYRAVPDPVLLFNIGQAYRLGAKPEKALVAYKSYLRTAAADAPNRTQVEARVHELEAESTLKEDMARIAATPSKPVQQSSASPAVSPASTGTTTSQVAGRDADGPTTLGASASRVTQPQTSGFWLGRTWAWVAAGSAVVFTGAATVVGLSMQSRFDSLKSSCGSGNPARPGCNESDIDAVMNKQKITNVLWGLAAAAAITAGALYYIEGRPVTVAPMAGETTGLLARVGF